MKGVNLRFQVDLLLFMGKAKRKRNNNSVNKNEGELHRSSPINKANNTDLTSTKVFFIHIEFMPY